MKEKEIMTQAIITKRAKKKVRVHVKTALSPNALSREADGDQHIQELIQSITAQNPTEARVLQQITREMSDQHDFLVATLKGVKKVSDPARVTLSELASPQEIRTDTGIKVVETVSLEVQAYCRVG